MNSVMKKGKLLISDAHEWINNNIVHKSKLQF